MALTEYKDLALKMRQLRSQEGPSRDGLGEADGTGVLEEQGASSPAAQGPLVWGDYDQP